jgi:hypothetical protein
MNRYPKLIPWYARKAGLPVELAEKLWRRASCEACEITGETKSNEYLKLSLDRFFDLLDAESSQNFAPASPFSWVWRHQRRMVAHSFGAANVTSRWWDSVWQRVRSPRLLV